MFDLIQRLPGHCNPRIVIEDNKVLVPIHHVLEHGGEAGCCPDFPDHAGEFTTVHYQHRHDRTALELLLQHRHLTHLRRTRVRIFVLPDYFEREPYTHVEGTEQLVYANWHIFQLDEQFFAYYDRRDNDTVQREYYRLIPTDNSVSPSAVFQHFKREVAAQEAVRQEIAEVNQTIKALENTLLERAN